MVDLFLWFKDFEKLFFFFILRREGKAVDAGGDAVNRPGFGSSISQLGLKQPGIGDSILTIMASVLPYIGWAVLPNVCETFDMDLFLCILTTGIVRNGVSPDCLLWHYCSRRQPSPYARNPAS